MVTIAGLSGNHRAAIDGKTALNAPLSQVYGLLLDRASGRLIINDQTLVERLEPDGTLLALAGSGAPNSLDSDTADGVPASALRLSLLRGMAQDSSGALYLAEALQGIVFRVALDGTVTKFFQAMPFSPRGMVFDSHGNLDIADEVCACIIRLDTAGVKSTVYKLPPSTEFTTVEGLAIDAHDNLFVTEYFGNQVLRIAADGSVTTIAGTGVAGFSGDGGRATEAQLRGPTGIAVTSDGTLYIGDSLNNRVRRVTPDGMISTLAGTGVRGFSGDGGPAVAASLNIPAQVVADGGGNLYVADFFSGHVRKISAAGIITTVAGNGDIAQTDIPFPPVGDGGPAIQATLRDVTAVVADPAGNLVVADFLGSRVRKIAPDGTISTLGPIDGPVGLALDGQGAIYVSTGDSRVRKIDPNGTVSLVAGTGTGTGLIRSQGDGGPATSATLNEPKQLAVDAAGNLYIADTSNARLRRVDTKGIIQTVSGPGQQGVDYWNGVAIDGTGTVFVATTHALTTGVFSQVQRLNADGSLTPIAGNGQFCTGNNKEFPYDGQAAAQIPLCVVTAITFDSRGMLYISEPYYGAVLQMAPDGTIRRIAGSLLANTAGDGGPVLKASLNGEGAPSPGAVAVDAAGNLYIPQALASRVREVPVTEMVMRLSTNAINWTGAQSQTIQVTTNFAEPMPYLVRLEADGGWLTANRSSGRTGEPLVLTGDPAGLAPGVHHGKVTITLPGAALESSAAVTFTVL